MVEKDTLTAPSHCSMATAVVGVCVKDRASHTGYTLYGCVPLAKTLKRLALFLGGHVNKDLDTFLVALVIFKCFAAAGLGPVALR